MLIFSDSPELPHKFLGTGIERLPDSTPLRPEIKTMHEQIFSTKKIHSFEFKNIDYWKYLFLTKNAISSQFDLVVKLGNNNPNLPDRIICIAERGSGFHGFRNRNWDSRQGNLHLSISFIPKETFINIPAALLIASAVSIIETIDIIPGLEGKAKAKWVNDIVIDNSKVGGIITQTSSITNRISNAFIGIGLNVLAKPIIKPDIFTPYAACLKEFVNLSDKDFSEITLLLLRTLAKNIAKINSTNYSELYKKYCTRSAILGKQVEVYTDPVNSKSKKILSGRIIGIKENLELLFENDTESVRNGRLRLVE